MKEGFRQSMAWLHTWVGLLVGWVLFFVFVTGTTGYVNGEISRWMQPELPLPRQLIEVPPEQVLGFAFDRLEQVAPDARMWSVTLPHRGLAQRTDREATIAWEDMPRPGLERGRRGNEGFDPVTGAPDQPVEGRATGAGWELYEMHYALHYINYDVAFRIVGVCTMFMLLAIISGVITHKKIFKDFFTFRPRKGQRSWLDAHNVISVMALPFFIMITYSGLVFYTFQYMPAVKNVVYGASEKHLRQLYDELFKRDPVDKAFEAVKRPTASVPEMIATAQTAWGKLPVATVMLRHPVDEGAYVEVIGDTSESLNRGFPPKLRFNAETGERMTLDDKTNASMLTRNVMLALHEGHFAGWWLRWLYFLSGVLGCAMIGTGLVLWTVKRRNNHLAKHGGQPGFGHRLVEVLNVGTIVGLPVAVAAYFWANRLLPIEMANRAEWEMHCLFATWGWMFMYAALRPLKRSWLESLYIAVAAFGLIPLLNFLTTDKHLGITIPYGDWVLAGFDLTMLGFAAAFAYMAYKLKKRWLKQEAAA
ncbi:PepSY domain-containing protein [Methylobacillus gramineus]|uniref:PepSY-associated TM helix domain-containing protein n=1 Tax=Methylobacillus gramineus TaxID=755169 RepID=UPI001CFF7882|nr:PepSY-associated TM helix domain-containing protein [Methylobacillus gramineus]MCB5185765.1 PepSY domain-containing protein [Methylobacillus gramineus]